MKCSAALSFLVWLAMECIASGEIEMFELSSFPPNKIALHMPCKESNMFATKCMCHIKCKDPMCHNAREICEKYSSSRGCRYMLMRGGKNNRIATLKRIPTESELKRFDISEYQNRDTQKRKRSHGSNKQLSSAASGPLLSEYVRILGDRGDKIVSNLITPNTTGRYCGTRYTEGDSDSKTSLSALFPGRDTRTAVSSSREKFLSGGISLAALSYRAPITLANSVRSWNASGLLSIVREKKIYLNDPMPAEIAIAEDHGLNIVQPIDIPNVKASKSNVITIGAAFYYALQHATTEYVLFLENDFKIDPSLSVQDIMSELLVAAGMLDSGIDIVRLQSRKYQGCGTFKSCDHGGINLKSKDMMDRKRNWFAFYCRGRAHSGPWVSDCFYEPDYRCFTSWDSNWTLNAVLVKKSAMMNKKYKANDGKMKSIADIGLSSYQYQDGFESSMGFANKWMKWKVPICISYKGLFIHEEIETGH